MEGARERGRGLGSWDGERVLKAMAGPWDEAIYRKAAAAGPPPVRSLLVPATCVRTWLARATGVFGYVLSNCTPHFSKFDFL
jgi:hypothetical protein